MSNELTTPWRFELTASQQQDINRVRFAVESINAELEDATCESQAHLDELSELQAKLKGFRLEAEKIINPVKAEINKEKERILDIERAIVKTAQDGERRCGSLCGTYRAKLEAEQRRIEEQARKDAEEARQAEIAEQAAILEEEEGTAAAEAYRESALEEVQPEVEVAKLVDKPKGTALRYNYSAEVVDITKVPARYLIVDQKKIDAEARSFKDEFDIPGCRLIKKALQSSVRSK